MLFKKIRYTDWFLEMEKKYWGSNKKTCSMWGRKLIKKHEENIIILCEKCHKHIHCKDKWRFS